MYRFLIGVMLDSFQMNIDQSLDKAVELGAQGLQVHVSRGELCYETLTDEKRREFMKKVEDRGLVISALCGDFGHGFGDRTKNPQLIEKSKRILNLARKMNTNIVTTHIGVVPENPGHERYRVMQEACHILSRYADEIEAHFAIETGPETAITLKRFLDSLNSRGVAVNMDPANLVMVAGDDPVGAVYTLKDYIVHTHAKDGRRLLVKDPELVFGIVHEDVPASPSFIELPLGEGDVDFKNYLKALEEIGYCGFLTIEREVGEDPVHDIKTAVNFLNEQIAISKLEGK